METAPTVSWKDDWVIRKRLPSSMVKVPVALVGTAVKTKRLASNGSIVTTTFPSMPAPVPAMAMVSPVLMPWLTVVVTAVIAAAVRLIPELVCVALALSVKPKPGFTLAM